MEPDIGELYLTDKTAFETVARYNEAVYFPSSCGNDNYQCCCGSGSGSRRKKLINIVFEVLNFLL
jgi:hypothetical protein